jgi:hypothetical protein
VLTTIPKMKTKTKKKMRTRVTKERPNSMMGNPLGLLFCEGPGIVGNVRGIRHVHVVMNHNPQEKRMGTNFTGLLSHLAFFYDPPFGSFSKFFFQNVKRYLINHLLSTIYRGRIFCLSFPSRDRGTTPGQCEYKRCYF